MAACWSLSTDALAQIRKEQIDPAVYDASGAYRYCASVVGTDAYACNLSPAITAYTTGAHYFFKADVANTGAATLQLNGISGPKTIKKFVNGSVADLADNDINAGEVVEVKYDGTYFQITGGVGAGGGSGISGLTTNKLPKASSATTIANSEVSDDGTNILIGRSPIIGNCATNCLTLDPSAITGNKSWAVQNANDTFVGRATADTLTNKTLDAEGSGNVLTTVSVASIDAASCDNVTASPGFDLPTANAPTPTCFGTTTTHGTLTFADGSTKSASRHFELPADLTGNIDVALVWWANAASTNAVRWSVEIGCVADGEAVSTGPSYNTASASNTAYTGTANQRKTTSFTSVARTNCAGGETAWLKISRIGADGGDTLTAAAELFSVTLKMRRAQ